MKIAQILLSPRIGGAETVARELALHFERAGHSHRLVYLDPDGKSPGQLARLRRLTETHSRLRPDVVLSHTALPSAYARIALPRARIATVLHSASDDFSDWRLRFAERVLLHNTSAVIAVGPAQAASYRARFPSFDKLHLIPNGVPDGGDGPVLRRRLCRISAIGRMASQKDPELFAGVAELMLRSSRVESMSWWGPYPTEKPVQAWFSRLAVEVKDLFKGPVSSSQGVLNETDLLLHTSRREAAGSLVILEAAVCGVPVICDVTVAEQLPEDVVVVPFFKRSPEGVKSAIDSAQKNWIDLSRQAHLVAPSILQKWSWRVQADKYMDVLRGLA